MVGASKSERTTRAPGNARVLAPWTNSLFVVSKRALSTMVAENSASKMRTVNQSALFVRINTSGHNHPGCNLRRCNLLRLSFPQQPNQIPRHIGVMIALHSLLTWMCLQGIKIEITSFTFDADYRGRVFLKSFLREMRIEA